MKKYFCLSRGLIAPLVNLKEPFYICQSKLKMVFRDFINEKGFLVFLATYLKLFIFGDNENDHFFKTNIKRRQLRFPLFKNAHWLHSLFIRSKRAEFFFYSQYFEKEIIRSKCKIILIWNGSASPASILKHIAQKLNLECFYWELGYFPNTVQVDPQGVNYDNSLPRSANFYDRYIDIFKSLDRPEAIGVRESKNKLSNTINLPKNYLFVPFQVPSDSQILDHSDWVSNMFEFYLVIYQAAQDLPNINFVIKEHPSYKVSIKGKVSSHPRIIFANSNPTPELIRDSNCVITINSTVGLESLVYRKPVITLGSACYNINELVHHCKDINELKHIINNLENIKFNEHIADNILKFIKHVLLIPMEINSKQLSESQYKTLLNRLERKDLLGEIYNDSK